MDGRLRSPMNAFQRRMREGVDGDRPNGSSTTSPVLSGRTTSIAFELHGRQHPVFRSARGAAPYRARHLRRQVQATRRERPVPHDHRAYRQRRLLVHPSGQPAPSPSARLPGSRPSPTGTDSPGRRPLPSGRLATPFRPSLASSSVPRSEATWTIRIPLHQASLDTGKALAQWFKGRSDMAVPWLRATTRWQVISGEIFLERLSGQQLRSVWPVVERWSKPADTLGARGELAEIARWRVALTGQSASWRSVNASLTPRTN